MKILAWGAAFGAVAALVACGGGGGNTGGAGGGAGGNATTTTTTVTSTSSSTSSSSSGNPVTCGGVTWDDRADCQTCMEDTCCSEMEACGPGTDCDAWFMCATACTTSACVDGCDTSKPDGRAAFDAMFDCYDSTCKVDQVCMYQVCMSGLLMVSDLKDCAECLGTNCCDSYTACMMDQGCGVCETTNPAQLPGNCTDGSATATLYGAAEACKDQNCGKACTTSICGSGLGYTVTECNYCLTQSCCTQFNACINDTNSTCYKCLTGATSGAACTADADFQAFTTCRSGSCATDCGG